MEDFAVKMGKNIRQQRNKCNLTQEQVAEQMRIKRETYNTIEMGKRALKDYEIVALARILNTSTDYILQGTETKFLNIAETTGLSNNAIAILQEKNTKYGKYMKGFFDMLNLLICTEMGASLISHLESYIHHDYSKLFINDPKTGNVVPYTGFIFVEDEGTGIHWGINIEQIEAGDLETIKSLVKKMKEQCSKTNVK